MNDDVIASLIKGLVSGLNSLSNQESTLKIEHLFKINENDPSFDFRYGQVCQTIETEAEDAKGLRQAVESARLNGESDPARDCQLAMAYIKVLLSIVRAIELRQQQQGMTINRILGVLEKMAK